MESQALRKSNALLQEINRTMKTEHSFESSGSSPKMHDRDHLSTQLDLLIDSCSLILARSHKLSQQIRKSNGLHVSQVNNLYSKYNGEIENCLHKTH